MEDRRRSRPWRLGLCLLALALYASSFYATAQGPVPDFKGAPGHSVPGWEMHGDWVEEVLAGYPFALAHPFFWAGLTCLAFGRLRGAAVLGAVAAGLAAAAWVFMDHSWSGRRGEEPGPAYGLWFAAGLAVALAGKVLRGRAAREGAQAQPGRPGTPPTDIHRG